MREDHSNLDTWSYSKSPERLGKYVRILVGATQLRIATVAEIQHSQSILHSKYKMDYSCLGIYVLTVDENQHLGNLRGEFDVQ
jgi:hypothetical protein